MLKSYSKIIIFFLLLIMNKKIFISYSWSDSKVVDIIDNDFMSIGIFLIKDQRDAKDYESLTTFMKKIRNTNFAILVISDDFLQSRNCMYEVIEFLKEKDFKDKLLPVVLDDVSLDPKGKAKYQEYWKKEYDELVEVADELPPEDRVTQDKDLRHYKLISMQIGDFLDTLSDLRFESYENLKATGFKVLFDEIKERAQYLKPPQVKILAITASPKGSPIFYEKEQDVLIDSIGKFDKEKLFLDVPDPVNATFDEIDKYLKIVEKNIHSSKNRTREAMNQAMISIGIRNNYLKGTAISVAKVVGTVEVDHGETWCKTPDAILYINKTWARRNKKNKAK